MLAKLELHPQGFRFPLLGHRPSHREKLMEEKGRYLGNAFVSQAKLKKSRNPLVDRKEAWNNPQKEPFLLTP
jgi:hypothetical protein